MARDIDVDIEALESFIQSLMKFENTVEDKLQSLQSAWETCDQSWKGGGKEEFNQGYEDTEQSVRRAVETTQDAIEWLNKFKQKLEDFNRR
jgi:WXG100 family type VII secretion target